MKHRLDVLLMVGAQAITPASWQLLMSRSFFSLRLRYQNFIWMLQLYEGTLSKQSAIPGGAQLNTVMQLVPSVLVLFIAFCYNDFDFRTAVRLGMLWLALAACPSYYLISFRDFWGCLAAQMLLAIGHGLVAWGNPFLMHSSFPLHVRVVAMGISYNLSAAIFGGPTPYICSELVVHLGAFGSPNRQHVNRPPNRHLHIMY